MSAAPPGWYDDRDPRFVRYWDGQGPEATVFAALGTALLGCASGVSIYLATEAGNDFAANTINDLGIAGDYLTLLRRFF